MAYRRRRPDASGCLTQVLFSFQTGGSERVGASIAEYAMRSGVPTTACATHGGTGPISDRLAARGIDCDPVAVGGMGRLGRAYRLYRHFRRNRTTVVHVQHFNVLSVVYGPARLAGVKHVVVTEHTDHELRLRSRARQIATRYGKRADAVTVVHQGIADFLVGGLHFDADRIHVIPNGVDTSRFRPHTSSLRRELGLPESRVLAGSVGRLHPDKDPMNLVRALRCLDDELLKGIHVVMVGEGECRPELESLIRDSALGAHVTLLGERHDIPDILGSLDVFVLPSRTEGLPVALLEAMASGLPAVATDVGGVPAALGECGVIVPREDPERLAEALGKLSRDPALRAKLGESARVRARTRFDVNEMFAGYASVLASSAEYLWFDSAPGGDGCAA